MPKDNKIPHFLSDEDIEFLPIIPIDENGSIDDVDVPEELPLLPLRNSVLFPGVVIPITVGREKSVKAVKMAQKGSKFLGVIAQKQMEIDDPEENDLYRVGTCLLYTSPSPRDATLSRMPSSA